VIYQIWISLKRVTLKVQNWHNEIHFSKFILWKKCNKLLNLNAFSKQEIIPTLNSITKGCLLKKYKKIYILSFSNICPKLGEYFIYFKMCFANLIIQKMHFFLNLIIIFNYSCWIAHFPVSIEEFIKVCRLTTKNENNLIMPKAYPRWFP